MIYGLKRYIYTTMWKWVYDRLLFITEEQTELNVVRDSSGITKRQDVSVGISYATVFNNIPQYESIAYIYFSYNLRFSLVVLFQLVIKVTMDTTVMLFVFSLHTVLTVSQYVTVRRQIVILSTGGQDIQPKLVLFGTIYFVRFYNAHWNQDSHFFSILITYL